MRSLKHKTARIKLETRLNKIDEQLLNEPETEKLVKVKRKIVNEDYAVKQSVIKEIVKPSETAKKSQKKVVKPKFTKTHIEISKVKKTTSKPVVKVKKSVIPNRPKEIKNMENPRHLTAHESTSLFTNNSCPNCQTKNSMVKGPSGGGGTNFRCEACHHLINLIQVPGGPLIQVINKGIVVDDIKSTGEKETQMNTQSQTQQQEPKTITQDIHGYSLVVGCFYWVLLEEDDEMYNWENLLVPARYAGGNAWHLPGYSGEYEDGSSDFVFWVGERITPTAVHYKDNEVVMERIRKYKEPIPVNESTMSGGFSDVLSRVVAEAMDQAKRERITMQEPPGFFERLRLWWNRNNN